MTTSGVSASPCSRLRRWRSAFHLLLALLLLVSALGRLLGPDFRRPFDEDEMMTVAYYTWAGIEPEGEYHPLRNISDFYALGRPRLVHLALGLWCGIGRWPEPNNQIPNSILVSLSTALHPSETAARVPALLGAVVFVFAVYLFCLTILRWRFAALVIGTCAWFLPHTVIYSQSARGYSLGLALQMLLLALLLAYSRNPRSIILGTVCSIVSIATIFNLVNTALDWIVPIYAVFFFADARLLSLGRAEVHIDVSTFRKGLVIQTLSIGGVSLLFGLTHLPSVISSARLYGTPFRTVAEFVLLGGAIVAEQLPGVGWLAFGLLGVSGLIALCKSPSYALIGRIGFSTYAVSLTHFALTHRYPYARSTGYLLPLLLLGAGYLVERAVSGREIKWRFGVGAGVIAAMVVLVAPMLRFEMQNRDLSLCVRNAGRVSSEPERGVYILEGPNFDRGALKYLPRAWTYVETLRPGLKLDLCIFSKRQPDIGWGIRLGESGRGAGEWQFDRWAQDPVLGEVGEYRAVRVRGRAVSPDVGPPVVSPALVFWYPDPTALGIRGDRQLDYLQRTGVRFFTRHTRYQAKLNIYDRIHALVIVAESADEATRATAVAREGIRRFGGTQVLFVPEAVRRVVREGKV
jgi:hypothetical protein